MSALRHVGNFVLVVASVALQRFHVYSASTTGVLPDVSGKKTGVRCKTEKGTCTQSNGGGEILEMELNEPRVEGGRHHFSKSNLSSP